MSRDHTGTLSQEFHWMYGPCMFTGIQYMNNKSKPNGRRAANGPRQGPPKSRGAKTPAGKVSRAFIATARKASTTQARVRATREGCHVEHKELLGTVNGSVAFTALKYVCNPGMAATFPWLSVQAQQWEQYRFNKLRFRYLTRTATTTVGSVLMAPDYDPSDEAPTSELTVSTYQDCVEDAVWVEELVCDLRPSSMFSMGARKFVRSGSVGPEDLKLYDAANLFLCTVEETGASAIGKLWVEYDVDFFVPQLPVTGAAVPKLSSLYVNDVNQIYTTATPALLLFPDTFADGLGIGSSVAGVFTPPRGSYRINCRIAVLDTSVENCTAKLELFKNGSASTPFLIQSQVLDLMVASGYLELTLFGIVNCSGSDTFSLQLTVTGAAGTLSVIANQTQLLVSSA